MAKASPEDKYNKKMPLDLLVLRSTLGMQNQNQLLSCRKYRGPLLILPELKNYVPEQKDKPENEDEPQDLADLSEQRDILKDRLYIKKKVKTKRIDEFDEIDREFQKKWLNLTLKRSIPKDDKKKPLTDRKHGKLK
jgi:hypothetical protein